MGFKQVLSRVWISIFHIQTQTRPRGTQAQRVIKFHWIRPIDVSSQEPTKVREEGVKNMQNTK